LDEIRHRVRCLRVSRNLSQDALSQRADVALRTLQRFEHTGHASLEVVVRLAFALGSEDALDQLFRLPEANSMDELMARSKRGRQRARGSK
jgi:transcriptional regulator with XRE-family HTH domain